MVDYNALLDSIFPLEACNEETGEKWLNPSVDDENEMWALWGAFGVMF